MLRPLLAALALLGARSTTAPAADSPTIKALFLGDSGHHRPADRAAQIIPVMAGRGIEVAYTDDMGALNPATLAGVDALIVYANIDAIGDDQAKALLDYVRAGGGFVPLHCASFCFRNNPEVVRLIGAQFQRHGTGEFDVKVVAPGHPIMKGLEPFRTWDETYVHTLHSPEGRTVLQTRAEGSGEEPWTWVKEFGKGRVFYTAYGHDARTWSMPGFQDLVERGIRWAARKGEVFDGRPRVASGLAPFGSEPARVPNYVPSTKWGAQGEPIRSMQTAASPAESARHMVVPGGFEARLFASEPEIAKPLAMAWDHRGRLWISESTDYPNNKRPPGQGRDRIKICEDTDGDGRADKFTVFADDLSIPTSLTFADGGVIVSQAPEMLFLKDTDGDDKADVKATLFTGWGVGDTHAGPSNLRRGLDGWVWGIVGYAGFDGVVGGERMSFRQGIYRFRPDGSKLEFLRSTSNNSWGLGFSESGLVFGSTANGCPSVFLPIPNRYYESVKGASAAVLPMIADSNRFYPVTEHVRQVDFHGGFTAAAGHALYTARTYPRQYWDSTAFVAEPTGHLLAAFTLQPRGTDFAAHYGWNLAASDDEWTSPIAAEVGPDGQVWMIDWYNFIVQHNPTPQGWTTGKGAAYETPLRDKTHGRVYRIVAKGGVESPNPGLDPAKPDTLIAGLKSANMFWRSHAQRLIVERGKADVAPTLIALATDPKVDAVGLNPAAIHALHALRGLGLLGAGEKADAQATTAARAGLRSPSAGVRRAAVEVLPRDEDLARLVSEGGLLEDADAQVRLAALLALSEVPAAPSDKAGQVVALGVAKGAADGDRNLVDASVIAGSAHARSFLATLVGSRLGSETKPAALAVAGRVSEHLARSADADAVAPLCAALTTADPKLADAVILGLAKGWPKGKAVALDAKAEGDIGAMLGRASKDARGPLIALATRWGSKEMEAHAAEVAASMLAEVRDESRPEAARVDAARKLVDFRRSDAAVAGSLLDLVTPKTAPRLAAGLVEAVGSGDSPAVGAAIAAKLEAMTPGVRAVAIRALLARNDWTTALMDRIADGSVALSQLALDQRQALAAHPDEAIAARARALLAGGGGLPDADRQKVIDEYASKVMKGGSADRGRLVFEQQCAKCHMHDGKGGKVGPDLTGMAAHPREELLIHIMDPSRSVEGNFVQYAVATNDGRVLNGLLASESRTSIDLVDAEGKSSTIPRSEIDELVASKKSLMPEGFEKQIPPDQFADLLAFLTRKGKYLPLDLRKVATAVSTRGMFYDPEGTVERLIFADWSPKVFDGVPFVLVDPEGDKVPNVILLNGPHGNLPPRMPKMVELPVNAPARSIHLLGGVGGWNHLGGEPRKTVSMIVRLRYADGSTEDHPLLDGVHMADYVRRVDVPGSKFAYPLRDQQVRYLAVAPKKPDEIRSIDLIKGPDGSAPVVMAVTVEVGD